MAKPTNVFELLRADGLASDATDISFDTDRVNQELKQPDLEGLKNTTLHFSKTNAQKNGKEAYYTLQGSQTDMLTGAYALGRRVLQAAEKQGVDLRSFEEFKNADYIGDGVLDAREVGATLLAASFEIAADGATLEGEDLLQVTFSNRLSEYHLEQFKHERSRKDITTIAQGLVYDNDSRAWTATGRIESKITTDVPMPTVDSKSYLAMQLAKLSKNTPRDALEMIGFDLKESLTGPLSYFTNGNYQLQTEKDLLEVGEAFAKEMEVRAAERGMTLSDFVEFQHADFNQNGTVEPKEAGAMLVAASLKTHMLQDKVVSFCDNFLSFADIAKMLQAKDEVVVRNIAQQLLGDNKVAGFSETNNAQADAQFVKNVKPNLDLPER